MPTSTESVAATPIRLAASPPGAARPSSAAVRMAMVVVVLTPAGFPIVETPHAVVMRDMLVDLAPYIFRGRVAGFLTRLSSTGLANVTSGGGQVPSFVVEPRES